MNAIYESHGHYVTASAINGTPFSILSAAMSANNQSAHQARRKCATSDGYHEASMPVCSWTAYPGSSEEKIGPLLSTCVPFSYSSSRSIISEHFLTSYHFNWFILILSMASMFANARGWPFSALARLACTRVLMNVPSPREIFENLLKWIKSSNFGVYLIPVFSRIRAAVVYLQGL